MPSQPKFKKKIIKIILVFKVEKSYNQCMLNFKGENNMSKNEVKQASLRSELWSVVHEVSKLDLDLAKKSNR